MRKRLGDTLIEVVLAIGIFSMVAIAVVAVVSGATSGAQSNLESTVARDELDSQAEALRFIHNAYVASVNTDDNQKYVNLWKAITARALEGDEYVEYQPASCQELYNDSNKKITDQHGFIINHRALGQTDEVNKIIISAARSSKDIFKLASTYPRLVYNNIDSLLDQSTNFTLSSVEGLFLVAIKDLKSTTIVNDGTVKKESAYYNIYIRSCWYTPGSEQPSTISTAIRLYDPDIVQTPVVNPVTNYRTFCRNDGTQACSKIPVGDEPEIPTWYGHRFRAWNANPDGSDTMYLTAEEIPKDVLRVYAVWRDYETHWVDVNAIVNGTKYLDGKDGFRIKVTIDGISSSRFSGCTKNDSIDFYCKLEKGTVVKVDAFEVNDYILTNKSTAVTVGGNDIEINPTWTQPGPVYVDVNTIVDGTKYSNGISRHYFDIVIKNPKTGATIKNEKNLIDFRELVDYGMQVTVTTKSRSNYVVITNTAIVKTVSQADIEINPTWAKNYTVTVSKYLNYSSRSTSDRDLRFDVYINGATSYGGKDYTNQYSLSLSLPYGTTVKVVPKEADRYKLMDGSITQTVAGSTNFKLHWIGTTMQNFNNAACEAVAKDSDFSLTDTRNNMVYTVRYIKNHCWMTSNLSIAGNVYGGSSNFPTSRLSDRVRIESERPSRWSSYYLESYDTGHGHIYNVCAASAGRVCGRDRYDIEDDYNICPAGWTIPAKDGFPGDTSNLKLEETDYPWLTRTAYSSYSQYALTYRGRIDDFDKNGGFYIRCYK